MPRLRSLSATATRHRFVRWFVTVLAIGGVIGGGLTYRHHKRYRHFAVHESGKVYRSAWVDADVFREVIEREKIRTVVNLCFPGEMGNRIEGQREAVYESGAKLLELPFPPNSTWDIDYPAVRQMEAVFADPANYPIWIHCQHGRERTVKALAIYDIGRRGMTAGESLESMPLFGMPHPWPTVVFAHIYQSHHDAARTAADETGQQLR